MTKWTVIVCLVFGWLSSACMGGLRVDSVATSADRPGNVAVYLSVRRGDAPAMGLTEKNFHVSEDGQDLTPEQTRQTLLPRDVAAVHRALLLVDMSGAVTEGDIRQRIASAAARFVTKAHRTQPVTVYAFDGGASIRSIGDYPQGDDEITEIPALSAYTPADPSSNLHSAVVEALAQLDARLMSQQKPIRIGSLVVFARGPDLAGRVTEAKMMEVVDDSKHLVFAIGSKDTPGFRASRIGKAGAFEAETFGTIEGAFDQAGTRVAETVERYYLLSYCSPARAGKRRLRVKVVTADAEGKELSGSASSEFDATGFGSGCDPNATPRFVVRAEPAEEKAEKQSDSEGSTDTPKKKGRGSQGAQKAAPGTSAPPPDAEEGEDVVPPPSKPGYAQ